MASPFLYKHEHLRLGEFDLGGVLYHANYFHLYELAREAFLRSGPSPYPELVRDGYHLAIAEAHLSYDAPILYGQPLIVRLSTREVQRATAVFHYQIDVSKSETSKAVHSGWTKNVLVQATEHGLRPARFPEGLQTFLQSIQQ